MLCIGAKLNKVKWMLNTVHQTNCSAVLQWKRKKIYEFLVEHFRLPTVNKFETISHMLNNL